MRSNRGSVVIRPRAQHGPSEPDDLNAAAVPRADWPRRNAALVDVARGGGPAGERAWADLVRANANAVWKALWSVSLPADERADLFQSAWMRALERLDQLREPEKFHVWIMVIARNEAIAASRRQRRVVAVAEIDLTSDASVDSLALERTERRQVFDAALARMRPECQSLLRLLATDPPLTYAEIEHVMGWRPGGTAIRRSRCIERLVATPEISRYLRSLHEEPDDPNPSSNSNPNPNRQHHIEQHDNQQHPNHPDTNEQGGDER